MKKLKTILPKNSGRSNKGQVTVRHQGGRQKRYVRKIDFKRDKTGIWGRIESIEYDPNRRASVALLVYEDGERRYIICPDGLKLGDRVISSNQAPLKPGNTLSLSKIPVGTQIHGIEISPGKGGQMVFAAGSSAVLHGKEDEWVLVKLPSGEIRRFKSDCKATLGQISNPQVKGLRMRKAGTKRLKGIRPTVRGTAQHPGSHPHGGGEGRSGVGLKHPKTPYGRSAVGKTRKKIKYSDYLIIKGRKRGKHAEQKLK